MSIQNELNRIKNAIYGKDIRQSIHDAIKMCYVTASTQFDNTNMEVEMARGIHETLKERLDGADDRFEHAVWNMDNIGQDVKEAMTGGSVAVVGENSILTSNIVDGQVTRLKTDFISNVDDYRQTPQEMMQTLDNCYYASSNYEVIQTEAYKIINIASGVEDIEMKINNIYRAYIFEGDPTNKVFVEQVGGVDNAGEQIFTLKRGHTLGLTIKKDEEGAIVITYAPNVEIKNLVVDGALIKEKSITKDKVDFLENINLNVFDGEYFEDYYLNGVSNDVMKYSFVSNDKSIMAIVDVDPNTTYTLLKEETPIENGFYYFKLATFTIDKELLMQQTEYTVDGAVRFDKTTTPTTRFKFTTGDDDKTLVVVVSKTNHKPYMEILKGDFVDFQYDDYQEKYSLKGVDVYTKTEVDKKINDALGGSKNNVLYKNGDVIDISLGGKTGYRLERCREAELNLDTWMLTRGTVGSVVVWDGSDIEGPIKEVGAIDFIGGVHGDEKIKNITILLDGTLLDLAKNHSVEFEKLTVFVESILYRCNTETPVLNRLKKIEFLKEKIIIQNKLVALVDDFIVNRYTGCGLYSVYKDVLTGYTVNTTPMLVTETGVNKNRALNEGTFYCDGFEINVKALNGLGEYYMGSVADFTAEQRPRFKFYFDTINSETGIKLALGEELSASFKIEIN